MSVIYKRNCDYCGKHYERAGAKRFCSIECVGKYNSERPRYPNEPDRDKLYDLYVCQKLGSTQISQQFNIPLSCIKRRLDKFGIPMRQQSLAQRLAVEQGRLKSREEHPRWKGGRRRTSSGYISLLRPEHTRADKRGYVAEHILVWEEANDKPLPESWVVHHLNGIKNDNRPPNLFGMPKGKHHPALIIQGLQKRIRELEQLRLNLPEGG